MLNLPEAVKTLFCTDGVHKNFRAHFPNSEMADITNDQVVSESVRFTESICSQSSLKFGLTEASMIEFETVGVGNMRGMLIECSMEIDVSSLSAAQISAIEAGSWGGTLVQPAASGLSYAVFRVPYGVFRVESCPRNQQAMAHRRVQAYSIGPGTLSENPFETAKLALLLPGGNVYAPQAKAFFYAAVGYKSPQLMASAGYEKTLVSMPAGQEQLRSVTLNLTGGGTKDFEFHWITGTLLPDAGVDNAAMLAADLHGYDYLTPLNDFAAWLEGYGVDPAANGFDDLVQLVKHYLPWAPTVFGVPLTESNEAILNYRPGGNSDAQVPYSLYIMTERDDGHGVVSIHRNPNPSAEIYKLTDTSTLTALDTVALSIPATLEQTVTIGGTAQRCWSFTDSVSLLDFANGFLELSAAFGRAARSGEIVIDHLSSAAPVSIGPGDMSELWWDETDVEPIGSVVYKYKDADGNDQTATCEIGSGSGVYDMTNNALFEVLANATAEQIEALIKQFFQPHAAAINYTPVQLDIRAMPWIEAADALQLTAEDSTVVNTYAMRHEISGIQALFAAIESSGDIG